MNGMSGPDGQHARFKFNPQVRTLGPRLNQRVQTGVEPGVERAQPLNLEFAPRVSRS